MAAGSLPQPLRATIVMLAIAPVARTILFDLMSDQPQPTKERRETAKAERIEAEQRTAAAAARKKRLGTAEKARGGRSSGGDSAISSSGDDKKSTGSAEGSAAVIKLYGTAFRRRASR